MQQQYDKLAAQLEKIHANLLILKENDREFLIQIGAALEKAEKVATSLHEGLGALIRLCIDGLQAVYEKQIADFAAVQESMTGAVDQTIQALLIGDTDGLTKTIETATQNLTDILATDHKAKSNDNASDGQSNPQTPSASDDVPPDTAVETMDDASSTDNEPALDEATLENMTLNDIATQLVMIDATDVPGLKKVRQTLRALQKKESYPNQVTEKIVSALNTLDDLIRGAVDNPNILYGEASRYIETALDILETDGVETADSQTAVEQKQQSQSVSLSEIAKDEPSEPTPLEANEQPMPVPESGDVIEFDPLPPDADIALIGEFITESREYIENSEAALLNLESNPDDDESVNVVFRAFHTIKGTSAFLGLNGVSEFAHKAENLYSRIRDGEIKCTGGYADLSLQAVDMVKELLNAVERAINGEPLEKPAKYDQLIMVLENPEKFGINHESGMNVDSESKNTIQQTEPVTDKSETTRQASSPVQQSAPAQPKAPSPSESSVRVSTSRLDQLIDMVGELVIAQSMVAQDNVVARSEHHELLKKVMHASKIIRELQDLTMLMRMVPLKPTFQKMARVVRDVARKSNKLVDFVVEGEDVEIDRNMVDLMNDPLVHMLRNAVDHGVELPDEREQMGKPKKGTVKLSAYHSGGSVILEITDDGRGLNREKIVEKAISKGIIDSDNNMTDNDVYNLIFEPGFSTAAKVTDVSGRGVGLDVVRKGVEQLRGRIDITSRPGAGSTFILRMPLTLAITDGMLVKVGNQRYIVPTINIYMSFRPTPDNLSTIAGKGEMVMLREKLMPIFRLHKLFEIKNAIEDPTEGLLVVVDDGERQCALLVDELLGQQQVVAKSLGAGIGKVQGISGGAILGDGRVGLILDTAEILTVARQAQENSVAPITAIM